MLIALLGILGWVLYLNLGNRVVPRTDRPLPPSAGATEQPSVADGGFTITRSRSLPRQGSAIEPEVVGRARRHLENGGQDGQCGPYALLSDVTDRDLLDICEGISLELDATYETRFGVPPIGGPAATILLFANREGYRAFAAEEGMATAGYAGYSIPDRGYTAIWADASRPLSLATTLAHELTHLVHRRALGGGLPRWLSEGLADAIGDTASLAGIEALDGTRGVEGLAERVHLGLEAGQVRSVARLVTLEGHEFDRGTPSYDYEQSALLVRYLLTDVDLEGRFRAFLNDLSQGMAYSPDLLQAHLALEWVEIDRRLAAWLQDLS